MPKKSKLAVTLHWFWVEGDDDSRWRHDLAFRTEAREWLMAIACDPLELDTFFARVEQTRQKINRNRPAEPLPGIRFQPLGAWSVVDGLEGLHAAVNRALHVEAAQLP
jgi:hypothetical protein